MNIFKLFKEEAKGKEMMKAPTPDASDKVFKSELIWQRFWGQYDGVMEMACMRKSVHLSPEHAEIVEKMFIESLEELIVNTQALVEDYKKTKESKCTS